MLCTTNHLSAVLSESAPLIPPTGPYKSRSSRSTPPSTSNTSISDPSVSTLSAASPPLASSSCSSQTNTLSRPPLESSPLFKPFALQCGFNATLVEVFHDIGYLYALVDAFTRRLLPSFRKGFEDIIAEIEGGKGTGKVCGVEEGRVEPMLPRHGLM